MHKPNEFDYPIHYRAKLARVVDADTVDVVIDFGAEVRRKERVRLFDVDTYELRDPDPDKREKAKLAKAFVEQLFKDMALEHGKWFLLMSKKYNGRGKYGRFLGDIMFDDGGLLTDMLVEGGHVEFML